MIQQSCAQLENQIKYGQTKEMNVTIVLFKKWLKDNDIEMYSTYNEEKSVIAERSISKIVLLLKFNIKKCVYR